MQVTYPFVLTHFNLILDTSTDIQTIKIVHNIPSTVHVHLTNLSIQYDWVKLPVSQRRGSAEVVGQ